ncbi:MAG: T9SS type A sorting domain-containing protein, partial [Sphingobacteriales bacterium]
VAIWPANPGQSATITLADMAGRQIASADGKDGSASFDLSMVPAGLYFITIQTGQKQITEKLFIAK